MTIDEAIERYTSNAEYERTNGNLQGCSEFKQLAEWLKELKVYKERMPSYEAGYNDAKREIALSGEYERAYERGKADAQPKIGRWIADVDRWGDIVTTINGYKCSECNAFNADEDNYCPNCGARMVSE